MNINNILNKIENYKTHAAERAEQERVAEEHHRQSLLDQIRVMKPDIDNLIKVAKAAQEAGISLQVNWLVDRTYDNGDFFADAMLVERETDSATQQTKKRNLRENQGEAENKS